MHVSRNAFLLVLLALCAAAPAAVAGPRSDLVGEILRRVPEWPGTEVEIPISVYEQCVRELAEGPAPPQPPVVAWIERAAYGLRIGEKEVELTAAFNVVRLPGKGGTSVRLLPADLAWRDATVDGRKTELRRAEDGWFHFDAPEPGRYRVVATTTVKPKTAGDVRRIEFGTPPAGWTSGAVDSDAAWDVRFSRAPLSVKGTDAGTHGTVGLAAGDRLEVRWQPPRPPVHRAAQIATEAHVGWTLADGVHQVRAILNLRLWGGETSELTVNLPPGADRVRISGPDVREVRTAGVSARVFLRGAISQRSRLAIEFESPRPTTGRMALPAFGVQGSSHRGGTLAVAGGAGAVLLEMASPGLAAMALHDLPARTRGLLAAPPVYAYRLTGAWEARVDLVSMSEFPVRETLIDSALYTVLYRPDGRVMVKVIYEVRNRAQQYMAVALPPGAELVVARVSEVQKNLARGPGRTVYVPLEKSVLTTAGLVSFPVELVYVMRAEGLAREGTFRLPLPRADLPVAYARCALMLPDGMKAGEWHGVLRRADAWSSETAELEFEYGRGHLAEGLQPKPEEAPETPTPEREPQKPKAPGLLEAIGRLFVRSETKYNAALLRNREMERLREEERARGTEFDERARAQARILQGKNLFRAGVDSYRGKNYAKAAELFKGVIDAAPKSLEANKAGQYLANVAIALGKERKGEKEQRGLRATAKAVQKAQQWGNIDIRERQKRLLTQADLAVRRGDEDQAEAAYRVAVNLARQLEARGEEAQEQKAVVRKAQKYLAERGWLREEEGKKVAALQQQVAALQRDIAQTGGQEMEQVVEALLLPAPRITLYSGQRSYISEALVPADIPALGVTLTPGRDVVRGPPPPGEAGQAAPQVEMGEALAEQQVTLRATGARGRRQVGVGGGGYAYGVAASRDEIEHLKKQVEQLKSIHGQLTARKPDFADAAPRFEVGDATEVTRPGRGKPGGDLFGAAGVTWEDKRRDAVRRDFGRQVAEKAEALKAEARKATELARAGRIAEAGKLIDRLEKRAQVTAGAAMTLTRRSGRVAVDDLVAKVPTRKGPKPSIVARRPAPAGEPEGTVAVQPDSARAPLRPSDARRHAVAHFFTDGLRDVRGALEDVGKAREALEKEAREQDKVKFNVADLTVDANGDRQLAEFVARNYAWALRDRGGQVDTSGIVDRHGAVVRAVPSETGMLSIAGGTLLLGGQQVGFDLTEGQVGIQVDGGTLVVANRPVAVANIEKVLERLRLNVGQRVGVASRNFFVDAGTAEAAGIRWKTGANGVRYAVINEGQLRGVMDVEQRAAGAAVSGQLLLRDAYQEAVVGTDALLANGLPVSISRAADERNTLIYNGNTLQVVHDDYLIVDNGGYLTAVKSGRMQHWSVEVEPVRFPGVPAAVVVPTVGYTVKFEKTLLDASDTLELVADYTWEGDER